MKSSIPNLYIHTYRYIKLTLFICKKNYDNYNLLKIDFITSFFPSSVSPQSPMFPDFFFFFLVSRMIYCKCHAVYKHTSDEKNIKLNHSLIWHSLKYHYTSFHLLRKIPTKTITVFLKRSKKNVLARTKSKILNCMSKKLYKVVHKTRAYKSLG